MNCQDFNNLIKLSDFLHFNEIIREEEYEDVDEISETESDDLDSHRSPPRGDQWDAK